MKLHLLLAVSLVLNGMLLVAVLRDRLTERGMRLPPMDQNETNTTRPAATDSSRSQPNTEEPSPFHWLQLETSDWFAYRDGLLRVGCPGSTVRHILTPLVHRHYASLSRERLSPYVAEFWERFRPPNEEAGEVVDELVKAIEREEEMLLSQLLGGIAQTKDEPPILSPLANQQLDFLPESVRPEVLKRMEAHSERVQEFRSAKFASSEEKQQALSALRTRLDSELSEILSPDQREELSLRGSPVAELRTVAGVDLTDGELWEVIRRVESTKSDDPSGAGYISESLKQQALEAVLGPDRAGEIRRVQQPEYQDLLNAVQRLGLPDDRAAEVWQAQEALAVEAQRLGREGALPEAELQVRVNQLKAELSRRVGELLGGDRGRETWEHAMHHWVEIQYGLPRFDPVSALESP